MTFRRVSCILLFQNIIFALSADIFNFGLFPRPNNNYQFNENVKVLLTKIINERNVTDALVYDTQDDCIFETALQSFSYLPIVRVTSKSNESQNWIFGLNYLILLCNATAEFKSFIDLKQQQTPLLTYADEEANDSWKNICDDFFTQENFNVAFILKDFGETASYITCRLYELIDNNNEYEVLQNLNDSSRDVYVEQFANMHGKLIRTDVDQLAPRSMLYYDANGKLRSDGFVGQLVETFAEKHNATLVYTKMREIGRTIFYEELENATRNNTLDIAVATTTTLQSSKLTYLSYPYLQTDYCFMLPIPAQMPYTEIYAYITDAYVLCILFVFMCIFALLICYSKDISWHKLTLLNVLLNDKVIRALLGQSFPMERRPSLSMKLVIFLMCFMSLLSVTMYAAYLQMLFIHPPLQPKLKSFDDICRSNTRVIMHKREADIIITNVNRLVRDVCTRTIIKIEDFYEYLTIRDTFNPNYGYTVTWLRWFVFQEQQQLFKKPVFYYSREFCINRFFQLCIPLRKDLPYRELFNRHILHVRDSGLMARWISFSFYKMLQLNLTTLKDLSMPNLAAEEIGMNDLLLIWYFYGLLICVSCLGFIGEWLHWLYCKRKVSQKRRIQRNRMDAVSILKRRKFRGKRYTYKLR